ncbi:MAG TPA: iron-containing redox enzyme family protein [Xanthobacteraceae bacterium]|jgi:pyrroloquinoline quinone (PQQ) biosynthesis protein C
MSNFQQLAQESAPARQQFMEIPLIQEVLRMGAPKDVYLDFLSQAYHHVKCTAPLLASAAGRCGVDDYVYQAALFEYIEEERGHELWILEDINALGGNTEEVRRSAPRLPCKLMVGHAFYLIDRVSPYAMLGMIHVLEGMAVALATKAVSAVRLSIASAADEGFKYLTTHSDLDVVHAEFFQNLVDKIDRRHLSLVIETATDFYKLYGDLFRELDQRRATSTASAA